MVTTIGGSVDSPYMATTIGGSLDSPYMATTIGRALWTVHTWPLL